MHVKGIAGGTLSHCACVAAQAMPSVQLLLGLQALHMGLQLSQLLLAVLPIKALLLLPSLKARKPERMEAAHICGKKPVISSNYYTVAAAAAGPQGSQA
eukprot:1157118-Pelagomonas_calceolata.AAC.4